MTLSNLVDDILLEARNNNIGESEKLSRHQIILWIKSYRSMLLKQKIDKGEPLDDMFTQTIRMHLSKVETAPGHHSYISDEELPKLLSTKNMTGLVAVKDTYGNLIQIGHETKMKYQRYRKVACKDYIAYKQNNRLCVEGMPHMLEYVDAKVIMEDPTVEQACYNPDVDEFPMPAYLWPTIKDLIFTKDLAWMIRQVSDTTNNSSDDNQNTFNQNLYRNTRR